MPQLSVSVGQKRLRCGLPAHHIHGPRRLLLQAIICDNPAALEAQPRAAAVVLDLFSWRSYPSPSFTCFHLKHGIQVPERYPRTRGREEEWSEERRGRTSRRPRPLPSV